MAEFAPNTHDRPTTADPQTVPNEPTTLAGPPLGAFGPYDLISVLGEGGMGVVYRARQREANRIVALKVVRANRTVEGAGPASSTAIDRFHTEAQAAALLQHENIVPVYDVGRVGEHYYFSMRLVEGSGLNEILRNGPLENRRAAETLLGVTRGVAEAHRMGILHRDMKPHNVMIDALTSRPMVADFGLAKVAASDDQLTRTGEAIGTPSYMPPEQISNAAAVDQAADIYSLGATFYHMLTGRPPFQAASTLATLRQVLYDEPVSPCTLNSSVDQDLETICLVCLQKEPGRRFSSATALAEDLERYLAGQPILARPIGRVERAIRWCRRNPLAAGLSGIAATLALLAFVSIVVGYRNTTAALEESERNFRLARSTVDELYTDVTEIDLLDVPGMQPLKEKLLRRALKYYQQLLKDREGDVQLSAELATNEFRAGLITDEIVSPQDAEPYFRRALLIQQKLLAKTPDDIPLKNALGDTWNALGRCQQRQAKLGAARVAFLAARETRDEVAKHDPHAPEYQRKLANSDMNLGILAAQEGDLRQAAKRYDAAQATRRAILDESSSEAIVRDLAKGSFNQGTLALSRHDECQAKIGELLQQQAAVPSTSQENGSPTNASAISTQIHDLENNAREWLQQATDFFGDAASRFESLVAKEGASLNDQFDLAVSYFMRGEARRLLGEFAGAVDEFQTARSRLEALVQSSPDVDRFREQLVTLLIGATQCQMTVARQLSPTPPNADNPASNDAPEFDARLSQTEGMLRSALAQLEFLMQKNSELPAYRYDSSVVYQLLAEIYQLRHDLSAAQTFLQQASLHIAALSDYFTDEPQYAEQSVRVASSLEALAHEISLGNQPPPAVEAEPAVSEEVNAPPPDAQ